MHMADALLSPAVAATMYVASGTTVGLSVKKLTEDENTQKLPTMAVASALVFAGQMINYTIPGTGSSGHMCGGMLLSALLGPQAGFLSMAVVLTIQCLFFADGGLMALGANIWNMGSRLFENLGAEAAQRARIIAASIIGCIVTLQMGAFSVVLETTLSGITELPFSAFCGLMLPIHLAIGLVEGLITAAVLTYVYAVRPELLRDVEVSEEVRSGSSKSLRTVIITLAVAVVVVGSHFASSNPDGLEWALFGNEEAGYSANMGLDEENFGTSSAVSETAAGIQEKTSFLPDYAFAGSDNPMGTTVSGIVGSAMVAGAALLICYTGRFFRKRN